MRMRHLPLCLFVLVAYLGLATSARAAERPDRVLAPYFQVRGSTPGLERLPLKETRAEVRIAGVIAEVEVIQVYSNEGDGAIEATYVFPGGTRAAVTGMQMQVGDREIEALIRTREAARESYESARQQGKTASLLEEERPNVFTMNVANIMPGDRIEVHLHYVEALVPSEGVYEFVYPSVVGPRYSTSSSQSEPEEDWVENPHGRAQQPAPYAWKLQADLRSGVALQELNSPSHKIKSSFSSTTSAQIVVDDADGGDRDFVLRYRLGGGAIEAGLMLFPGAKENYFLAMVQPPKASKALDAPAREYIFIVDVSGSMSGFPMATTRALMRRVFATLRPTDKFNLLLFAGGNAVLADVQRAIRMLADAEGGGATEILGALKQALAMKRDSTMATSFVIITDGYVNVEERTFELIKKSLGTASVFAFGIGSSVNRYLIEGLARAGMGQAFVALNEKDAERQAKSFARYISSPLLTHIRLAFDDFDAYEVTPASVPDVFAERPVLVFGKYRGKAKGTLRLHGRDGQGEKTFSIDVASQGHSSPDNRALRLLWARHRIEELQDLQLGTQAGKKAITKLGLEHGLMTPYTSFVAIDPRARNKDGRSTTIRQALPLPQGVSENAISGGFYGGLSGGTMGTVGHGSGTGSGWGYGGGGLGRSGTVGRKTSSPPAVRVGKVRVTGSLDKTVLQRYVRRQFARIRYCYEKELVHDPSLSGTIEVLMSINERGEVTSAKASGMGSEDVESCVAKIFSEMQFPAVNGGETIIVRYPLRFQPAPKN